MSSYCPDLAIISARTSTIPSRRGPLAYGTAGFRARANLPMDYIFYRMGILAYLRSLSTGGRCIGLMITASHNAEQDNGVKLVDPDGGMLAQAWERHCERLVAAEDGEALAAAVSAVIEEEKIPSGRGAVVVGRDTRPHSLGFSDLVKLGVHDCGGAAFNLGEVTTPQLHFAVKFTNENAANFPVVEFDAAAALRAYFDTIVGGYEHLLDTSSDSTYRVRSIIVDVAGGVGHRAYQGLSDYLSEAPNPLSVDLRNPIGSCSVNSECGAEYVQKGQAIPRGISTEDKGLMCSVDGDADRIVFHINLNEKWHLIDGDKISALLAVFLFDELRAAGLESQFTLGIVQTAYANGASTKFLRDKNIPIVMAKTGVKFLHAKAHHYDIGVYFEANGHGTVLFSNKFITASKEWDVEGTAREAVAKKRLRACIDTINQAVGDALSDMLAALAVLEIQNISSENWVGFYSDFPSKQAKIPLAAHLKSQIVCSEDETRVVSPSALQATLDSIMEEHSSSSARCFVRPSGTEDVVRVYAEATSTEVADRVAVLCRQAIESHFQ